MNPLISVIVPVYNVEKYLDRCIESIVNQTYKNLEIILIDDGSPDNCPYICDEWKKRDKRIVVYHKRNGGLSDARNYGMARSKGKYIAFVDSDDYLDKDMYMTMLNAIIANKCSLACCGRFYVNNQKMFQSKNIMQHKVFSNKEAIHELLNNGCIEEAVWDKLYLKELWDGLKYPLGEINEDLVIMPEILRRSKNVVHVGESYYFYCYNGESITKSGYSEKKRVIFNHLNNLEDYIERYFPEEKKYVNVLEAKYAMNTMFSIIFLKDGIEKYRDDYKKYKQYLKKGYKQFCKSENISVKQKIEGLCLILGVYKYIWIIKRKFDKRK